jgi:hypothetical protein
MYNFIKYLTKCYIYLDLGVLLVFFLRLDFGDFGVFGGDMRFVVLYFLIRLSTKSIATFLGLPPTFFLVIRHSMYV